MFHVTINRNKTVSKHYHFTVQVVDTTKEFLALVKRKIREYSELLGIDGVFVALAWLMDKSKLIEIPVRIAGTIFVGGLAILAVVVAAWRWIQNPIERALRGLAKLLGIRFDDDDD